MASKTSNPAAGLADRDRKSQCLAACVSEITETLSDLNENRVAHLARRFRLSPIAASIIASFAFGEAH